MREKGVDERVGLWFEFGEHDDGTVDVHCGGSLLTGDYDVFVGLPRDLAEKVIAAHDEFRQKVYDLLKDY